jgi:hypothetical protein
MTKKVIRRTAHILSGIAFCIAFPMLCAVSDNMGAQLIWTISWAAVAALSGKVFVSTK